MRVKKKNTVKSAIKRPAARRPGRGGVDKSKGGSGGAQRASILTKHHAPGASPWDGSEERRAVLKWRAMELKIQGYTLRDIAKQLAVDFELEKEPGFKTVDEWLDEAFAETVTAKQLDADRHLAILMTRTESIVKRLLPLATGRFIVRRTRIRDGEPTEIIDENVITEMLASAAEARKQMDFQAKLLKIGRAGGEEESKTGALSGHGLTVLVEKIVTENIVFPGQQAKSQGALMLSSGDADVDVMDAEGIMEIHPVEPV